MTEAGELEVGQRVYCPGEADDWPLGHGVITDLHPDFGSDPEWRNQWVAVTLDEPAQRHDSDGPPRKEWLVKKSSLMPPREGHLDEDGIPRDLEAEKVVGLANVARDQQGFHEALHESCFGKLPEMTGEEVGQPLSEKRLLWWYATSLDEALTEISKLKERLKA